MIRCKSCGSKFGPGDFIDQAELIGKGKHYQTRSSLFRSMLTGETVMVRISKESTWHNARASWRCSAYDFGERYGFDMSVGSIAEDLLTVTKATKVELYLKLNVG